MSGVTFDAGIRAVALDAGGTVLHPESPGRVYAEVGRRHGSRRTPEELGPRFADAFRREEEYDRDRGHRTDEAREEQRWRRIVAAVLDDVADAEACFRELYDYYRSPRAWRVEDDVAPTLAELRRRGLALALASNFDGRLHPLAAGRAELQHVNRVILSAEVGWRKPAKGFFDAVGAQLQLPLNQILYVGDDPGNDYHGARAAGLPAVLFDPRGRHGGNGYATVARLGDLLDLPLGTG